MKKNNAFTLIELLVVVAIISLLVSILLPSLGKAKVLARVVLCQSNQRQLIMGCNLYAEENQEYFPPGVNFATYSSGCWWFEIASFMGLEGNSNTTGAKSLFFCPEHAEEAGIQTNYYYSLALHNSYGKTKESGRRGKANDDTRAVLYCGFSKVDGFDFVYSGSPYFFQYGADQWYSFINRDHNGGTNFASVSTAVRLIPDQGDSFGYVDGELSTLSWYAQ